MSMFLQRGTCMRDAKTLHKVLGTRFKAVELHATPQNLIGYQGDTRAQTAEIIVRREFVGGASNDIGFKKNTDTGNYDAMISSYDSSRHNEKWLENLSKDYLIEKARSLMSEQDAEFIEQTVDSQGWIHLKYRPAATV